MTVNKRLLKRGVTTLVITIVMASIHPPMLVNDIRCSLSRLGYVCHCD